MINQHLDHPAWKLAGMTYRNFYYPPDYWLELAGVDPRQYPGWFTVRNGLVGQTPAFNKAYNAHIAAVKSNWASLGVLS